MEINHEFDPKQVDLLDTSVEVSDIGALEAYDLNIFNENELKQISQLCMRDYDSDLASLSAHFDQLKDISKLFSLGIEKLSMEGENKPPWDGYPNVKLPTITFSVISLVNRIMNFFAGQEPIRASLLYEVDNPDDNALLSSVLKCSEKFMNHIVVKQMTEFHVEKSRTMTGMMLNGNGVNKTDFNPIKKRPECLFIKPDDIIVNYTAPSLDDAKVITQRKKFSINELKILMKEGYFRTVRVSNLTSTPSTYEMAEANKIGATWDSTSCNPIVFIQYRELIMDDSGIAIPVIVYLLDDGDYSILRIENRFNPQTMKPVQPFTCYAMIEDPCSWVGIGLGGMMLNLVVAQNYLMNLMLAAIQLSQTQGGFMTRRAGLGKNSFSFKMGQFIEVQGSVQDIKNEIMPVKWDHPSDIIFRAISFVQDFIDRLTTVTELFTGGVPRSDTSATASNNAQEQGSKNLVELQRCVARKFQNHEIPKILDIITLYFSFDDAVAIIGDPNKVSQMYDMLIGNLIQFTTTADPSIYSKGEMISIAQRVVEHVASTPLLQQSMTANIEATKLYLESLGIAKHVIDRILMGYQESLQQIIGQAQQAAFQQGQQSVIGQNPQEGTPT